jgi:hypothetical protein
MTICTLNHLIFRKYFFQELNQFSQRNNLLISSASFFFNFIFIVVLGIHCGIYKNSYCKEIQAPKVTTWRGVIWPRDSLLSGGRGREQREPRERERGAGA